MYPDDIFKNLDNLRESHVSNENKNGLQKKLKEFFSRFRRKNLLSGVFVVALAFSAILLSQRIINPVGKPDKSSASFTPPWAYPRLVNVAIVRYFNPASQPAYRDPASANLMSDYYQGYIRGASIAHGNVYNTSAVAINVLATYDYNEAPPGSNIYWEDAVNQILNKQLPSPEANGETLCSKVDSLKIDQIWFMADPTTGLMFKGPEFAISSRFIRPGSVPTSFDAQVIPSQLFCGGERSFGFMFLDLSRGTTASLHSFGHYMESLIGNVQGYDLFYKRFMGVDYAPGGSNDGIAIAGADLPSSCGSVHTPPNATAIAGTNPTQYKGYDYESQLQVSSTCLNWNADGTGTKAPVSSGTWVNNQNVIGTTENRYLMWWMQNMPNVGNTLSYAGAPIPNWWDFVVDLDATISTYLKSSPYYMNPTLLTVPEVTSYCSGTTSVSTTCTSSNL